MRKSFFIYTAISAAALLQSCEDKDVMPGGGIPAEIGSEVSFGAAMDLHSSADSRTVYGDEFRSESNLLKRAIWWRHAEIEGATDTVFIMCPEAAPGTQFGYFEVKPQGSKDDENLDRNVPAPVAKVYMDTTIRVGSENTHNFFGFYPSSAISRRCIEIDKNIVHATLPMNQISVFDATSTGNNKVAEPDMTNCHMVAFTSTVVSAGQPVSLTFQPAATVFDITVSGPPPNRWYTDKCNV